MKLELKHLKGYLDTGLRVELEEQGIEVFTIRLLNSCSVDGIKPILRPLSDITKEIEVNGEKFVPIDWIDKNHNANNYAPCAIMLDGTIELGFYKDFQKLFEWHFDIFGLIEKGLAIDFNNLNN